MHRLIVLALLLSRLAIAQTSATGIWAPTGPMAVDGVVGFLDQATNVLWCSDFTPSVGITSATSINWYSGSGDVCSVAIYDSTGTTQIAVGTGTCNTNPVVYSSLSAFSLTAGTLYRECWCFKTGANGFYINPVGSENMAAIQNAFVVHTGSAANSCTAGVPPATTGALTAQTIPPASVWISKE